MNLSYGAWKKSMGNICNKKLFPYILLFGVVQAGIVEIILKMMEQKGITFSTILILFIVMLVLYSVVNAFLHIAVKNYFADKNKNSREEKIIISFSKIFTIVRKFLPFAMLIYSICLLPVILYGLAFDQFFLPVQMITLDQIIQTIWGFMIFLFISLYLYLKLSFAFSYFFEFYTTKTYTELLVESWNFSKGNLGNMFFSLIGLGVFYNLFALILSFGNMQIGASFIFSGIHAVFFYVVYNVLKEEKIINKKL